MPFSHGAKVLFRFIFAMMLQPKLQAAPENIATFRIGEEETVRLRPQMAVKKQCNKQA
jgi:hypothetical protein